MTGGWSAGAAAVAGLAAAQTGALALVLARLLPGRSRLPAVGPRDDRAPPAHRVAQVSVVVPARNEGRRIGHCLAGLLAQGATMREALVVDGGSTDDTAEQIDAATACDARIQRLAEPARPPGAVGRPWAIAAGCRQARGAWVLIVDADVSPHPGMVAGALAAALRHRYDAVSFSPRIVAPTAAARALQTAFAATLVYRFGAAGVEPSHPERAVANGQCQLIRRAVLEAAGGYERAARSFCDDITIVRLLAERGARVGFLDGHRLFDCLMYPTARETWRAWPRSLGMRDATPRWRRWGDATFLALALVLPLPLLLVALVARAAGARVDAAVPMPLLTWLLGANAILLATRVALQWPLAPSFAMRGVGYWLAPLADGAAALRVIATSLQRSREWRGDAAPAMRVEVGAGAG